MGKIVTLGEVVADVYEMDLPRVKVGSPVKVSVVSYPKRVFEGKVDWISGMLDPTTRTARVRCTFDNSERLLRPEMFATVSITVDEKKALALPHDAIVRMGEQTVVFVEIGRASDGRTKFVGLQFPEGQFTVPFEKFGDTQFCAGFDAFVQVHKTPAQMTGQAQADGTFAGPHKAGQANKR